MGTVTTPERRGRPPRLDRGRTVDEALRLLDENGLDALTMRRLAEAMNAQAGALYRYFATKQDLLTAMAERMLGFGADAIADSDDWRQVVTVHAHRLRAALLAHRDGARVYAGTRSVGPNTLGFAETVVASLISAGFTPDDAARAMFAVVHFTVGHTLEEQAAAGDPADVDRLSAALDPESYPALAAAGAALTGPGFTAYFEFGLTALISGLRPG
ncbi:TetR/AcrR family transcriptional regulator C-terminal domain-containing protein [Actinoplanes derwentensis]|uniref:Transcriptional regulator, TetR family n=1 Tax=Actinoplanes derwentensis TaxID=113562 RepID=A0A1H2B7L1_9ACTN|nr:TetR/AcrR family transcriptional regulator C-terminal domain-containing protein [Actinoplanes derwentensis]SDT54280.1 transcriptional regulator, TetR family [Actinoplanes derwentensis]